ncbi:protein ced-11 [Biomphalaria glabrata]|nr:protein ced-11 [Biomphalaria glabrata]
MWRYLYSFFSSPNQRVSESGGSIGGASNASFVSGAKSPNKAMMKLPDQAARSTNTNEILAYRPITTSGFEFHLEKNRAFEACNVTDSIVYKDISRQESWLEMLVTEETMEQVDRITQDMADNKNMKSPKLVLTLISSAQYFKHWKRQQDVEDFQDGLMKAASLTEMWILLDTRNEELTAMIGEAIAKEKSRRNILKTEQMLERFPTQSPLPKLTVVGVVRQNDLSGHAVKIKHVTSPVNEGLTITVEDSHNDIDSQSQQTFGFLTHKIVTSRDMQNTAINSFILKLELNLMKPLEQDRTHVEAEKKTDGPSTPLIGLLKDGGLEDIDHVLALLRKNVPVIVICGQGKAAGLLAFAYRAAQQSYGTDNYETYVKTELLNRLSEYFPKEFRDNSLSRNQYRDKILQCIAYATQGDYALLSLVERNTTYELKDLSKVILNAVITSLNALSETIEREQLLSNMQLIIDWIQPELAVTEIFEKYGADKFWIDDDQFEQVLVRPGRQEFVELFLDRGFSMYKYLNPRRLEQLFERCSDKDFFVTTCLETVLGEKMTEERPIPEDFVSGKDSHLNHILVILTGLQHLIDPLELSLNTSAYRTEDVVTAEHRALHALIYWAVLTNNQKLVRIFWSRTNEPVAMALVLSNIYKRLSQHWISNHDLKEKMKSTGIMYGRLAIQLLDLCFNESESQALSSLTTKLLPFNNYTVMDLAMIGKNKYFIAHPCCQKRIFNMWHGHIRINQRHGFLSDNVKIVLCLLLVLPTYFWIETVSESKKPSGSKSKTIWKKPSLAEKISQGKLQLLCKVPFFNKLYFLWRAPLVKFWLSQIFFMAFLVYFMFAMAEPFCGKQFTNWHVSVWLLAYICDYLYIVVVRKLYCAELPIFESMRAIAVFAYTLTIIAVFRLAYPGYLSFTIVKTLLSFSLIYFCYLAMGFLFPVSPVYGPMMVNTVLMMKRDLITWLKMWMMTLISGAVAVQAALYPAFPLTMYTVLNALRRGIFAIFMTEVADIREGGQCSCLYNYTSSYGCQTSSIPYSVQEKLEKCVNNSTGSYLILLQYIFITKLVYVTLIFTVTRVTLATTYERSVEIWKYQLFLIVVNNHWRPMLPVPLVLLYYPFVVIKCCYLVLNYICRAWCPCCARSKEKPVRVGDLNIWRGLMRMQKKNEKLEMEKVNQVRTADARLKVISKDQSTQSKQMDSINDRLIGIINSQTTLSLTLEHMKHVMEELGNKNFKTAGDVLPLRSQHTRCRMSPYPGTSIRRYPVFDKNVSWEENYPAYDPPAFSRPEEEYEEDRRPYLDPNMFELQKQKMERERLKVEDEEAPQDVAFSPEFNAEVEANTSAGEKYVVDRTSWITKDDQPMQYVLDTSGVPRNPMGRTGLRGRGNLWRWGPNHMIYAIVSRWKSAPNDNDVVPTHKMVNGMKVMEILVVHNDLLNEDSLPGDFISGKNSKYNVICEVMMRDLLGEKDVPSSTQLDQEDMIQFFRQFVVSDLLSGILGRSIPATSSLSSTLVYKGYMDDSNNTDNAWVEAEVWNFHYHSRDRLDNKIVYKEKHWREVSSVLQLAGSQLTHVLDVARMYEDVRI